MASAPRSISSRTALRADASSSGVTTSPREFMRWRIGLLHDNPAGQRSRRLRPREMQDLLKVFRDQKTYFGALFLQHDVGRYRGAVKERGDIGGGDPSFLDQLLDPVEN